MRLVLLISFLFLTSTLYAHGFMPENDLHLNPPENLSSMSEKEFGDIVDMVLAEYVKDADSFGVTLVGEKKWSDGTVNAYAFQRGDKWHIAMFGGLARRPEVTPDGFALVVCHELGHHFAGYPGYYGRWASSEGNSDYWATQACAKRIWGKDTEKNAEAVDLVDDFAKEKCDEAWKSKTDRDLCYRSSNAGYSLALLLSRLGRQGDPSFDSPDPAVVSRTNMRHPKGQCRLDTYFQGALCLAKHRSSFIPGKYNPNGQDSRFAEYESAANSCFRDAGYAEGVRPKCWFAPGVSLTNEIVSFGKFY